MFRLNRKVEYALMALKYLGEKPTASLTSAKEVSAATGGPFDATARVMQLMMNAGLLRSEQGVNGGYAIVKDLRRVSFFELNSMILGQQMVVKCLQSNTPCELEGQCNIQTPAFLLQRKMSEFFKDLNVADLLSARAHAPRLEL